MSKEQKIRFIVGTSDEWCSKPWYVKIKRDDVYIMSGSGKFHKISLHGSGVCHSAVPQDEIVRLGITPEQRTAIRWKVQPEAGQAQLAFTILIAFDQMKKRVGRNVDSNYIRIPTPPIYSAAVIQFIKTRAEGKSVTWELAPGIKLLASVPLASGDNIAIIYYYSNAFNHLIEDSKAALKKIAMRLHPEPPLRLSSGFVTASDRNHNFYHIELKI